MEERMLRLRDEYEKLGILFPEEGGKIKAYQVRP